ncbi:MAG: cytochrome C oxidase subunit IV family protein [Acidobacteria bacterium]|nr:cytochrome C oxidase subunit IV family protein [Acidobacteriota bacterium]
MSGHKAHGHAEGSTKLYLAVWIILLALSTIEVYLGYIHLNLHLMLSLLMGLSLIKAGMIIAYFMHLRFERASLIWTLLPMWIIVTCLLFVFFPDSFRAFELRFP